MQPKASRRIEALKAFGTSENSIMAFLSLGVGLAGGFGAVAFRYLIRFFQALAYGSGEELLAVLPTVPWYARIAIPAFGGALVGTLVYWVAREAKGHGVPEVMEAVALKGGIIRKRVVLVKALASALCIGTGGAVGREGPIVQIGSAIGSSLGQLLKVSADRMRTLVGCGAAAGIGATFNAPIAGSMFALEIILGDFGLATFSPIVISSVTATAISRHFLGDAPAFAVPAYQLVSAWEFFLYLMLGALCAATAVAFTRSLYRVEDFFERLPLPAYAKPALGGFLLGLAGLGLPQVLGVGYGAIDLSLAQAFSGWLLCGLVVAKIAATAVTIGSGGSGGIFAPSLFMGAMAGGGFGTLAHAWLPNLTASAGAYGIVGMGAVVSATTHGPLTAILMLFEMTGNYKIILPLMVTCIISSQLARQVFPDSIYSLKLVRRGIDLRAGREVNVLKSIRVDTVMSPKVETVPENMRLGSLAEKISKSKFNSFPVLDQTGRLSGIISFADYRDALFDEDLKDLVVVRDLATQAVATVCSDDNLYHAFNLIASEDFAIVPVVSARNPSALEGVLSRRDIVGAYERAVLKKALFKR